MEGISCGDSEESVDWNMGEGSGGKLAVRETLATSNKSNA